MSSSGVEKRGSASTVRACDSCRRRKRKCAWAGGLKCVPCTISNEECATTHIRKPRGKSQRRNRIVEYENRIQKLETLLEERNADQPTVRAQPLPPADLSIPLSQIVTDLSEEVTSWPIQEGPQLGLSAIESGFDEVDWGEETRFNLDFEEASIPPIFPEATSSQPPPEPDILTGFQQDTDLLRNLTLQQSFTTIDSDTLDLAESPSTLTRARCDGYLPSPELGTSLLREFLVDFNTAIPLYRPSVVVEQLRVCFTNGPTGMSIAWASTYVILGIAHRLRAMSAAATPEDNNQADYYLSRVLCAVPHLLLEEASLPLIQCLLALAFLIQTSCHPGPHGLFVSTALRMAQCLAYNDDLAQAPDADIEQQHRVFWIAFFNENDASILSNAPTTHRREDIAAIYPRDDDSEMEGAVVAAEGTWKVNIFKMRICLAIFQAEAIEDLFSVQARKTKHQDLLARAETLAQHLAKWRNHELFTFSPEQLERLLYRSDLVHVVNLEASCFATTHRLQTFIASDLDTRVNPFSVEFLTGFVERKEYPCLGDARRFLSLLSVVPQGDIGLCWMIKLPIIAALCTVLGHALQNPQERFSVTEVRNYSRIVQTLNTLAEKSKEEELQRARKLCLGLFERVVGALTVAYMASGKEVIDAVDKCPIRSASERFMKAVPGASNGRI